MNGNVDGPLFGDAPEEVPLSKAPLARVVAQVLFDPILILRREDTIAPFQNSIRSHYPKISHEKVQFSPVPMVATEPDSGTQVTWRFFSSNSEWRVSITPTFLALETIRYGSRADFMLRLGTLVTALRDTVGGDISVSRIGMRYVDRILSPELEDLPHLVRADMLGVTQSRLAPHIQHTVTEALCNTKEGQVSMRWGTLPSFSTHDINVILPDARPSWFLDIDSFVVFGNEHPNMDANKVGRHVMDLAKRSYSLFRWAVTDKFLETYGSRS